MDLSIFNDEGGRPDGMSQSLVQPFLLSSAY